MLEYTLYLRRRIHWPKPDNFTYLDWMIQDGIPPNIKENESWNLHGLYRRQNVRFAVCYPKNLDQPTPDEVKRILLKAWSEYV
jgi:hypothetical protein